MENIANEQAEIYELQTMLRLLSQTDSSIPLVNPDGIFGPETERAVLAFQSNMGLPPTGTVDFTTWTGITASYRTAYALTRRGMAIFPFSENNYTVEKNEESDLVRIIQILLSGIDVAYGIFAGVALSGVYDDATENAVRAFQKIHFLPQTGVVDIHTWNRIASDYNLFERNPIYIG